MSKKLVVTGASGFLGSHLLQRLKNDSLYSVFALTSRPEALKNQVGGANIQYFEKQAFSTTDVLSQAIVIHCAFPRTFTGEGVADGIKYNQALFEASVDQGAEAIINISSQSVYASNRKEPASEASPLFLDSSYAVGKYAAELLLESICKGKGIGFTSIRLASLIGPGFHQRIVNKLIESAIKDRLMRVNKNERRFGFLDVQDACEGILSLIQLNSRLWDRVYNLGNGEAYTVFEIASRIKAVLGAMGCGEIEIQTTQNDESGNTGVSGQALYKATGFLPKLTLDDSIRQIAEDCLSE